MGQTGTRFKLITQTPDNDLKILWIPEHRNIIFKKGKRTTESEICSDRDYFFYLVFRILELYTWRYNTRKISMMSGSIIKSISQPNVSSRENNIPSGLESPKSKILSPHNTESPRSTNSQSSPRVQAVENVLTSVTVIRKANSSSSVKSLADHSSGIHLKGDHSSGMHLKDDQREDDVEIQKDSDSVIPSILKNEFPIFKDVNKYKSTNRDEILDMTMDLVKQYVEDNDSGKLLLAINEYTIRLPIDDFPHFINYRPNYDCLLNIQIGYRLNFYSYWMTIPGSYLYLHEWKYLLDQGLLLLNSPIADDRLNLGKSSVTRYIDLLIEAEQKIEIGQILINSTLDHYTEIEIMDNLDRCYEILYKNELDSYFERVMPHIRTLPGIATNAFTKWYHTHIIKDNNCNVGEI